MQLIPSSAMVSMTDRKAATARSPEGTGPGTDVHAPAVKYRPRRTWSRARNGMPRASLSVQPSRVFPLPGSPTRSTSRGRASPVGCVGIELILLDESTRSALMSGSERRDLVLQLTVLLHECGRGILQLGRQRRPTDRAWQAGLRPHPAGLRGVGVRPCPPRPQLAWPERPAARIRTAHLRRIRSRIRSDVAHLHGHPLPATPVQPPK